MINFLFLFLFELNFCFAKYQGPLIDASFQWSNDLTYDQVVKLIKSSDSKIKVGIALNTVYFKHSDFQKQIINIDKNKDLFFWGSPKFYIEPDAFKTFSTKELKKQIEKYSYHFVSEIMFRHADKINGKIHKSGERYIDPLSKESIEVIKEINSLKQKIPLYVHWEFYKWEEDYPKFTKLFNQFPNQVFIINHLGYGSPKQVETLLNQHSNVYFTISKKLKAYAYFKTQKLPQGAPLLDQNGKIDSNWKKLMTDKPERFLFSVDAHKKYMYEIYSKEVKQYREFLDQLPLSIAEKIAYKNALTIFKLNKL